MSDETTGTENGADNRSFAELPVSLGERRADQSMNAAHWSPREALLAALRDLDRGNLSADALLVIWRKKTADGVTDSHYLASSPDVHTTLGLLEMAKHQVLKALD